MKKTWTSELDLTLELDLTSELDSTSTSFSGKNQKKPQVLFSTVSSCQPQIVREQEGNIECLAVLQIFLLQNSKMLLNCWVLYQMTALHTNAEPKERQWCHWRQGGWILMIMVRIRFNCFEKSTDSSLIHLDLLWLLSWHTPKDRVIFSSLRQDGRWLERNMSGWILKLLLQTLCFKKVGCIFSLFQDDAQCLPWNWNKCLPWNPIFRFSVHEPIRFWESQLLHWAPHSVLQKTFFRTGNHFSGNELRKLFRGQLVQLEIHTDFSMSPS